MERMNALDAGFFFAENEKTPLHIASITLFDGPPPAYGELIRTILAKLPEVPRYRQRVRTVPLNLGLPVWVDDPDFNVLYHVRRTAVPPPGGPGEMCDLVGRVMSQRLDLDKPLWELWLVEGLAEDRWAVIAKVHHCVVDGVGGSDLITALFDTEPHPADGPEMSAELDPDAWTAERPPSALSMAFDGLSHSLMGPATGIARRLFRPAVPCGLGRLREARDFADGLPRTVAHVAHHGVGSLSGPLGPHRHWTWLAADLDLVKGIRRNLGGTVNDIVLAAVSHGFRTLLEVRGELTEETLVRSLVPVSVRGDDERGILNNRVSALVVELPCGEPDPVRRLELLSEQMNELKRTHQAVGADALLRLAGTAPMMLSLASRAVLTAMRPMFQTVTTNVPGPQFPLYVLGRRAIAFYPYVPVAAGAAVSIGIFSYLGRLHIGVTGDFDAMPDLEVLSAGIEAGFNELAKHAKTRFAPATGLTP